MDVQGQRGRRKGKPKRQNVMGTGVRGKWQEKKANERRMMKPEGLSWRSTEKNVPLMDVKG